MDFYLPFFSFLLCHYFQNNFKYHINTTFTINNEDKYKYRAIELQPHWNLTGDFMCSVQTYHTRDRKIKRLQMIGEIIIKTIQPYFIVMN